MKYIVILLALLVAGCNNGYYTIAQYESRIMCQVDTGEAYSVHKEGRMTVLTLTRVPSADQLCTSPVATNAVQ